MPDGSLGHLRKTLQQPRQCHFQPDMIVCHIDLTVSGLTERADPEGHAIAFPAFLFDLQHVHARCCTRETGFKPTNGFVTPEMMRNGNDQRC